MLEIFVELEMQSFSTSHQVLNFKNECVWHDYSKVETEK